jgi:hypothetical protein
MRTIKYIECSCGDVEHVVRFAWNKYEKDFNDFEIYVFVRHYRNFFQRLWYGIKYIFGSKRAAEFNYSLLDKKQVTQLRDICQDFILERAE